MTRFTATPLFSLLVLSAACANFAAGQAPKQQGTPKLIERVEYLFREGIAKDPLLRLIGAEVGTMASIQPRGLRFNVPAGRANTGDVGVEARLRLRGDFEVTLEYDVVAEPNPAPKFGAGAVLQVLLDTPDGFKARLARSRRPEGTVLAANYVNRGPDGKEKFHGIAAPRADEKETKGLLRLVRAGKVLSFQVAEGSGGFRMIAAKEVGLADVLAVQALCATGGQPVAFEAQFPRLELRSAEMPGKAGANDKAAVDKGVAVDSQAERVTFQFRDGFTKQPMLRLVGADVESMAVVEPQGLRFNVPAGRANTGDVGIESRLRLRGDFEITLEYELVALPNPAPPLGAGAVLQILLDAPGDPSARMDRLHRAADDVFGANYEINKEFQGLAAPPADATKTKGHLRMIRTGNVLIYQVQEGGPEFYEIATREIGPADVIAVQALCGTGWQPAALTVRFPRLELRSSKAGGALAIDLPTAVPIGSPSRSGGGSGLWIAIGLCAAFSLLLPLGLVVFLWKRGTRALPATAAAPQTLSIVCSDCGKKLKAKLELAGKKIKCPQCGKTVLVAAVGQE